MPDTVPAAILATQLLANHAAWPGAESLRTLLQNLKDKREFTLARRLAASARAQGSYAAMEEWLKQQQAKCTYKDGNIPARQRFDQALDVLGGEHGVDFQDSAETLRLIGNVQKRRWELLGDEAAARMAIDCFIAAWQRNHHEDMGFGGIQAAFLLDAIALRRIAMGGSAAQEAEQLQLRAQQLRHEMRQALTGRCAQLKEAPRITETEYWQIISYAEVLFGLRDYVHAGQWLAVARGFVQRAAISDLSPQWQCESSMRQLVRLAQIQGHPIPTAQDKFENWDPAWQALCEYFHDRENDSAAQQALRAFSCWRGKVGLALSGGGFRASFFHLGVMARLAEMDALRFVDVISSVSGGSILAGHYYLKLKKLLQTKPDVALQKEDYLQLVRELIDEFCQGVESNLRVQATAQFFNNIRMALSTTFSRTHRLGELYESNIYSLAQDGNPPGKPRIMPDLTIQPVDEPPNFNPNYGNWHRAAKVPVWIVNATSLNTGHNWQFTARSMGESPGLLGQQVDMVERYRRLWYADAPNDSLRKLRMGYAVVASSCVPVLFDPLSLSHLFPERTVQLIDGGVFDNQGGQALLEEDCSLIFCSDASGQMGAVNQPDTGALAVPSRMSSVLMDRLREVEYQDLSGRAESGALGLFYIHMKQDLRPGSVSWIGENQRSYEREATGCTSYGIDRQLQTLLAAIRTDLDAFSEVETHALMYSGYRMTEQSFLEHAQHPLSSDNVLGPGWSGFEQTAARSEWRFLRLEAVMRQSENDDSPQRQELAKQLGAGAATFGKAFKLISTGQYLLFGLSLLLVLALLMASWPRISNALHLPGLGMTLEHGLIALLIALLVVCSGFLTRLPMPKKLRTVLQVISVAPFALAASTLSRLYLWCLNPLFLRNGKLQKLLDLPLKK